MASQSPALYIVQLNKTFAPHKLTKMHAKCANCDNKLNINK